jgi:hypothetical protein
MEGRVQFNVTHGTQVASGSAGSGYRRGPSSLNGWPAARTAEKAYLTVALTEIIGQSGSLSLQLLAERYGVNTTCSIYIILECNKRLPSPRLPYIYAQVGRILIPKIYKLQ